MAKGMDLRALDEGNFRHPLFGNRGHWYPQRVKRGWWTESLTKAANTKVRKELVRAVDDVLSKLAK